MRIFVCIDDTDDIDSKGTGEIATEIAEIISTNSWGQTSSITRHQLFVHPDIPYTSHNSAMCFQADIQDGYFDEFVQRAAQYLGENSAAVADPGLCIVPVHALASAEKLIQFGLRAKKEIITKDEAYNLAAVLGIHLSEHGGTGQGVIGALAGAGLRLSGRDGRFKGKIRLDQEIISVEQIIAQTSVEAVETPAGEILAGTELIKVCEPLKTVLKDEQCVLLVNLLEAGQNDGFRWTPCTKQQLRDY